MIIKNVFSGSLVLKNLKNIKKNHREARLAIANPYLKQYCLGKMGGAGVGTPFNNHKSRLPPGQLETSSLQYQDKCSC